jgi:hypothetical protein
MPRFFADAQRDRATRPPWPEPIERACARHASGCAAHHVTAAGETVRQDTLQVFDAADTPLWTYTFPYVVSGTLEAGLDPRGPRRGVIIEDLDGDGHRELVIRTSDATTDHEDVWCFDWDGRLRWSRRPDRQGQYGEGLMAPPWQPSFLSLTGEPGPRSALWVSWINRPLSGAFIERLDVRTGNPLAVYWSAGYVTALAVGVANGRPTLFVGAANNEHQSAGLAAYDLSVTAGSSPAENAKYACTNCPAGRPIAFFVFPRTDVARALAPSGTLDVAAIMQDAAGKLSVAVRHNAGSGGPEPATVLYFFDAHLRVIGGETVGDFRLVHERLEREGRLDHALTPDEERAIFPVLAWDAGRKTCVPLDPNLPPPTRP